MSFELQHVIDDLTTVNTVVRHTASDLRAKVVALIDTVEDQVKVDLADILGLVDTIHQAAHSTASAAALPEATASATSVLSPSVDLHQLAAEASAAEDAAAGLVPPTPDEVEQQGDDDADAKAKAEADALAAQAKAEAEAQAAQEQADAATKRTRR